MKINFLTSEEHTKKAFVEFFARTSHERLKKAYFERKEKETKNQSA